MESRRESRHQIAERCDVKRTRVFGGVFPIVPAQKIYVEIGKYTITSDAIMRLRWSACIATIFVMVAVVYLGRNNPWIDLVEVTLTHFT